MMISLMPESFGAINGITHPAILPIANNFRNSVWRITVLVLHTPMVIATLSMSVQAQTIANLAVLKKPIASIREINELGLEDAWMEALREEYRRLIGNKSPEEIDTYALNLGCQGINHLIATAP